jgi:hypothetical protein
MYLINAVYAYEGEASRKVVNTLDMAVEFCRQKMIESDYFDDGFNIYSIPELNWVYMISSRRDYEKNHRNNPTIRYQEKKKEFGSENTWIVVAERTIQPEVG